MRNILTGAIRSVGIIITALAIPLSLMTLFALQGVGSEPNWVVALYIVWALVNLVAVPFMLAGFILRYDIKAAVYLALIHLALTLAQIGVLVTGVTPGDISVLLLVSLPAIFYVIGYLLNGR